MPRAARPLLTAPEVEDAAGETTGAFTVSLDNFEGPFDLLLQLIARHKLDVTEIALSKVTDEFIAHVAAMGAHGDLEQTTSFLVVAATLLDLKTARLLPQGELEDPEDLALLEARDLLFARLLQYRAFKIIAGWLGETLTGQGRRHPRPGGLEPQFAALLPEVQLPLSPTEFARLAARAMTPKQAVEVSLAHLHQPQVSVQEEANVVVDRLRAAGSATFRSLTAGAEKLVVVARFLGLLELFRRKLVAFEQLTPLGELTVRWTGGETAAVEITDEFDGAAPRADAPAAGEDGEEDPGE